MNNNNRVKRSYHFAKHVTAEHVPERQSSTLFKTVIIRVNVVRPIASLVFGKNHSTFKRLLAGSAVMAIGVMIAKYVGHSHNEIIAHIGDGIGYGLHGMGLIPFIESIAEKFE